MLLNRTYQVMLSGSIGEIGTSAGQPKFFHNLISSLCTPETSRNILLAFSDAQDTRRDDLPHQFLQEDSLILGRDLVAWESLCKQCCLKPALGPHLA